MADQAGPSANRKGSPNHSFSEAMLWAQVSTADAFDASDACSGTSTFKLLPELSSSNSCPSTSEPHNDLLSFWIANYMATSQPDSSTALPAADAEPAFTNAELDVPSLPLPDWNTSSFDVTKSPPKWMPLQAPDLAPQPYPEPGEHFYGASRSSWRAETSISPCPDWNNSAPFPVQTGPARRELFRPHSAAASTLNHHYHSRNVVNMQQGTANAFGVVAAPHHAPVSFLAPGNYAPMARPSWSTPIGSWSTDDFPACHNNTVPRLEQKSMMMLPQTSSERPYRSESSRLLPAATIATVPPPLLTSFGGRVGSDTPSWFPRAAAPLPSQTGISHQGFQSLTAPGESSTPSRKRSNFAMEGHSGVQWAPSLAPRRAEWGTGPSTAVSREVIALGPALNTNGKPRASRGSATDPQSVYARFRREKITDRMKTLQGLVPNGTNVDIVTMLDEAHDYVKFLEHQIELLKSEENWKSATPSIYKGIDLSKPQPPKPCPGRLGDSSQI